MNRDIANNTFNPIFRAEERFSSYVSSRLDTVPLLYDKHFYFVDVAKYQDRAPNWFNFVRNPVERFVSDFHYNRNVKRWTRSPEVPPEVKYIFST